MLAVQRQAHALHQWRQRFGNLGEVLGVCTQSAIHPTSWQSRIIDNESRPDLCEGSLGASAVREMRADQLPNYNLVGTRMP